MLRNLVPDSGRSGELEEAISKIQRSNNELNSCVMVLEDENSMLRGQVESLQERLAGLAAAAEVESPMPSTPEAPIDIDVTLKMAAPDMPEAMDALQAAPGEVIAPALDAEPAPQRVASVETDIDVDTMLQAAVPAAAVAASADEDIDSLLESFARDAAPASTPHPPVEKSAPAEDDTDALLADLFGDTPPATR